MINKYKSYEQPVTTKSEVQWVLSHLTWSILQNQVLVSSMSVNPCHVQNTVQMRRFRVARKRKISFCMLTQVSWSSFDSWSDQTLRTWNIQRGVVCVNARRLELLYKTMTEPWSFRVFSRLSRDQVKKSGLRLSVFGQKALAKNPFFISIPKRGQGKDLRREGQRRQSPRNIRCGLQCLRWRARLSIRFEDKIAFWAVAPHRPSWLYEAWILRFW